MSPKRTIKSMTALFAGMSFLFAGNALIVSSIGVILKNLNISDFAIGLINSCFFLGAMFSTMSAHKIISKVGHIRAFGIFAAIFSISIILHIISNNLYLWALLRFFLGACYYALLMTIESWLNEKAKNSIRSRVLGFYEIVFYLSFGIGILLIAFDLDKTTIFILSAALIMFSSIPLNLIRIKEPTLPKANKISFPKIFNIAPLALVTSFIAGMCINGFFSMSSLFILSQNLNTQAVAYFIFCAMLGGFFAQILIGTISDKLGRKFAIMICASIGFLTMLVFLLFNLNLIFQCILSFLLGIGVFCLYALALARANDMLEDKSKTIELGRGVLFCYSIGSLFAPLILGALMQFFSSNGFIWFYLVCLGFLILFTINKPNIIKKRYKSEPGSMAILNND
ncbi:MFS transporter [Campylobacter sp. CCS1377]|uniref:MFS transporter n=1 Tax=Campylobacter sp. CCS1377 TaxID=3158229 RepID=A0AAU7E710_9BACT|nr:MFS transporter [Campylobacter jejuni]